MLAALPLLLPARTLAQAKAPEEISPEEAPAEHPIETAIPVPVPSPSGLLLAWRPMILTVRVNTGSGSQFGSNKLQPLRGLARYTVMANEGAPFFGRFELEGGQYQTDKQTDAHLFTGSSNGYDFTARVVGGAATRLSPGVLFIASLGGISRYTHGGANGGAPSLGIFGVVANAEVEWRIYPIITLGVLGEAAVAPYPFGADANLGDLSDSSEVRLRVQLTFDLARNSSLEVGYDFTRWHSSFANSSILGAPNQALLIEAREYAFTLGVRWRM
jgi:hypothetical protein